MTKTDYLTAILAGLWIGFFGVITINTLPKDITNHSFFTSRVCN